MVRMVTFSTGALDVGIAQFDLEIALRHAVFEKIFALVVYALRLEEHDRVGALSSAAVISPLGVCGGGPGTRPSSPGCAPASAVQS